MNRDNRAGENEGNKSGATAPASVVRIIDHDLVTTTLGLSPCEMPSGTLPHTHSTPGSPPHSMLMPCYGASLVSAVLTARAAAAAWQPRADLAATRIQSTFRMYLARRAFLQIRLHIVTIQRVYRGYARRTQYAKELHAVAEEHAMSVFHYYATRIQACYRGFHSRRTKYNFYALRAYMADIHAKSEAVRQMATQSNAELQRQLAAARHTAEMTEFAQAASKLHFMLSTDSMAGVYRRPQQPGGTTTNWGSKVEEDIRHNATTVRRLARRAGGGAKGSGGSSSSSRQAQTQEDKDATTTAEHEEKNTKAEEEEVKEEKEDGGVEQPAGRTAAAAKEETNQAATHRKAKRFTTTITSSRSNNKKKARAPQEDSQRGQRTETTCAPKEELRLPHIHAAKVPPLQANKSCQWELEEAVPPLHSLAHETIDSDDDEAAAAGATTNTGKNATWPKRKQTPRSSSTQHGHTAMTTSSFHRGFCVPSHECGVRLASGPDLREVAALQRSVDAKLIAMVHGTAPFKVPKAAKLM